MTIEKQPFTRYKLDEEKAKEKRKVFTVSLNLSEQELMLSSEMKRILQQEKTGTIIKTLAEIGAKYIQAPQIKSLFHTISENKRKNKRLGISEFE